MEIWAQIGGGRLSEHGWTDAEQIHYFGLCELDHSDCPYNFCGIKSSPHKIKIFTKYDKMPSRIIMPVSEEESKKWYRGRKTIPLTISHIEEGLDGIKYVHYFFNHSEDDKEYWALTTPGYLRDKNAPYHQAMWNNYKWVRGINSSEAVYKLQEVNGQR